jgi:hypothetical protein
VFLAAIWDCGTERTHGLRVGAAYIWLAQGQNAVTGQLIAAVLVLFVTAWYTVLTHRIMKATAKQASAALQPELSLCRFARSPGETFHTILIQNSSGRSVVFLDVVISCIQWATRP